MDDWQRLDQWTQGRDYRVERVRLKDEDIVIEGSFEPSPLGRLKAEDQIFVAAFMRAHGSIKQMEESYGLSYPTIKNRLRRISEALSFLDIQVQNEIPAGRPAAAPSKVGALLDQLEAGEVNVKDVLESLGGAAPVGGK